MQPTAKQEPGMLQIAIEVVELLRRRDSSLVLAESCTCGFAAVTFGGIPGVSEVFCGSQVVYQNETKSDWLQIDSKLLEDPKIGAVSAEVTGQLACEVLKRTSRATLAAAITGHLGPLSNSDQKAAELDGQVYIAIAMRSESKSQSKKHCIIAHQFESRLQLPPPRSLQGYLARYNRQCEATELFLRQILQFLHDQN